MRVVHVCPVLPELKLVFVGLAGLDSFLAKPRHSIHTGGHKHTMPVNTGVFWKLVRDVNAHPIPLHNLNGWAMNLAIESPAMSAKSWREFVINFFSDQMEYFDASRHFKGSVDPFGVITGV